MNIIMSFFYLLSVTKLHYHMKMPPVEVFQNLSGRFSLISSADLGMVALWPMIFLFSRLIILAMVLDFLILEAAFGERIAPSLCG
jgi:hypothetical protein